MKLKLLITPLFFCTLMQSFSQNIPKITSGDKNISVKKIAIKSTIIGDIAFTEYDMYFYNPYDRVLEGEFAFPLSQNQSVTRYALDVGGILRNAVVVEKEKARVAFENTVRNRIDPALLEQTKGNNYKSRIYPIPAKGYKRVLIEVQQKLILNKESYYYELPFKFKNKLENYSLTINVLNQKKKPLLEKGLLSEFTYDVKRGSYTASFKEKKIKVSQPLVLKIPLNINQEKIIATNNYFYYAKKINYKTPEIKLPNTITIFWDTSLSQKRKKLATELGLLNTYFEEVKNLNVNLVTFNTGIKQIKKFTIVNGSWSSLKNELQNTVYDGGSSFNFLHRYEDNSTLNFLFTDGLNTMSGIDFQLTTKTFIVNSVKSANYIKLKAIAEASGGGYINLTQESIKKAFDKIKQERLQFLGTNISEGIAEIYPAKGTPINTDFYMTSKGRLYGKEIKVYLGTEKDTIKTLSFTMQSTNKGKDYVSKIWAQQKLNHLLIDKEKNKDAIIELSEKYQVISPYTSLLVLDRLEDYVTHEIEPPVELREEYKRLLAQKRDNRKENLARLQNNLLRNYKEFFNWYGIDYQKTVSTNQQKNITAPVRVANQESEQNIQNEREFTITGIVNDENGDPLPGVSVLIKGTTIGTETDFDGKYTLNVNREDVIVCSFIGYRHIEKEVTNDNEINIEMKEDGAVLDEVVVAGYVAPQRRTYTAAATVISIEEIETVEYEEVSDNVEQLSGSVAGVSIEKSSVKEASGIRGVSSIATTQPLYVVNGELMNSVPSIEAKDVESIYILKDEESRAIYGDRSKNGIVVIITKNKSKVDEERIEEFEAMVEEKIELKGWNPDTPYLRSLAKITDSKLAYNEYLILRKKYHKSPSFYIDIADFFKKRNSIELAKQVLSNVAEIELDNYELLRSLAYKFEEYELYDAAVHTYEEIIELRPEDIQSYRDLALAYEKNKKYQKSVDLLYKIVNGELLDKDNDRRFDGVEMIALVELNRMVQLYKNEIEIQYFDSKYIKNITADIRVVIDWNHNDTDIDLWVIDPNKEECYYKHKKTKIGGLMSNDMTQGFGPEQFILKEAIKGEYKIKVKYYASSQQKVSGPTALKLTMIKNYGKPNETRKIKVVRLENVNEKLDLGKINF
ncbi:VIT domain-containing protein [Tenacibaculum agarivorans]|uniref:VIT domain-containing protein n=1 Tax=Tenacibaculum agarivorans TaxID=1908389 RepID=UPI0009F921FD|nr:VIT domain-containing protein [Tenacibaculum agarivorans]